MKKQKIFLMLALSWLALGATLKPHDIVVATVDFNKIDSVTVKPDYGLYDIAHKRFSHYNKDIADSTVQQFIKVAEHFSLDTNRKNFDLCISQICLESGAKQYRANGKIMESSGNAIGITQIVPMTAFHYLRNVLSDEDKELFKSFGCTDFSFVDKYPRYKYRYQSWSKCREWLSNEDNNITLWGYIMRNSLKKRKYINSSLVAYNAGDGYLSSYLKKGHSPSKHEYVIMINKITKKLEKL